MKIHNKDTLNITINKFFYKFYAVIYSIQHKTIYEWNH